MRKFWFGCTIIGSLIGCNNQSTSKVSHGQDSVTNLAKRENHAVDDNFETFLHLFSEDSLFQINRIIFPVRGKVLELNEESEYVEIITQKDEHSHMDFRKRRKENPDGYTISTKLTDNKATVEVRGIDNGIFMDYYFEKINGKWMFVSYKDSST